VENMEFFVAFVDKMLPFICTCDSKIIIDGMLRRIKHEKHVSLHLTVLLTYEFLLTIHVGR